MFAPGRARGDFASARARRNAELAARRAVREGEAGAALITLLLLVLVLVLVPVPVLVLTKHHF